MVGAFAPEVGRGPAAKVDVHETQQAITRVKVAASPRPQQAGGLAARQHAVAAPWQPISLHEATFGLHDAVLLVLSRYVLRTDRRLCR
jgi:hypothetical protein